MTLHKWLSFRLRHTPTGQSSVDLDYGHEMEPASGRERQFGLKKIPLRNKQIDDYG